MTLLAPFPYFGGKRSIASEVWRRLGTPKQYIEPFCGSAAVLLAAPAPASLEVGLRWPAWEAVSAYQRAVSRETGWRRSWRKAMEARLVERSQRPRSARIADRLDQLFGLAPVVRSVRPPRRVRAPEGQLALGGFG